VPLATTPQYPLRVALKKNDMRSWTPNGTTPMLLCGGHNDPEVFFSLNTGTMEAYWPTLISSPGTPNVVTVLDVDPDVTASGIATSVGTLAATAYANALAGASPSAAQISSGVLIAVVSNTAFAPYFTGGVPNSPQGVLVAGVANVAAQAAGLEFTAGVRDPAAVGAYVGDAINKYYHFPVVQSSCLTAVGGFFLGFHPFN
jgi:hypothetical protein